jgi:asparagine synthase (glutamine-hydrolysing)
MYSGLEVRVPFCDHRIAEYLYSVPWAFKDHNGKEKGLLRKAMEGVVPEKILWRKKSPYPKTFDPKYRDLVETGVKVLLADPTAPLFSLVDRRQVEQLFHAEPVWPWYGQLMRVPQTLAYLLQLDYWLRHYQVRLLF